MNTGADLHDNFKQEYLDDPDNEVIHFELIDD